MSFVAGREVRVARRVVERGAMRSTMCSNWARRDATELIACVHAVYISSRKCNADGGAKVSVGERLVVASRLKTRRGARFSRSSRATQLSRGMHIVEADSREGGEGKRHEACRGGSLIARGTHTYAREEGCSTCGDTPFAIRPRSIPLSALGEAVIYIGISRATSFEEELILINLNRK